MRSYFRAMILVTAWTLTAPVGSAGAAVTLFSDSFGGDTAVSGATDVSHPALQGADVGKDWKVRTTATNLPPDTTTPDPTKLYAVQVRDDDPAGGTNNYVKLQRNGDATVFGYAHARLTTAAAASTVGSTAQVSFRLFVPTSVGSTHEFRVLGTPNTDSGDVPPGGVNNAGAADFGANSNAFAIRFLNSATPAGTTKNVTFVGGSAVSGSGTATFTLGIWNTVTIDLDYVTRRYLLTVANANGSTTAHRNFPADGAPPILPLDRLGAVQFTLPGNNSVALIDDVTITTVPEPMSLAALGLAGVALAARRRRRPCQA